MAARSMRTHASTWNALHGKFLTKRINHEGCYSDGEACTNMAEDTGNVSVGRRKFLFACKPFQHFCHVDVVGGHS